MSNATTAARGKVYTFGSPRFFRAESQKRAAHLTRFWMLEP